MSLIDTVKRAGLLDPRRLPALTAAVARWGPTVAAPVAASSLATPGRACVIDDDGAVTFSQIERSSTQLAKGLHRIGAARGDLIGIACRNHREFVELTLAAAKAGLGVVYLNTSFGMPQMTEVIEREGIAVLAVDHALLDRVDRGAIRVPVIIADMLTDGASVPAGTHTLTSVRSGNTFRGPLRASLPVPPILLTSGTTGTPKGARRGSRVDSSAATGIIERIPYRHDDVVAVTSPLFHAWGLAQATLASTLGGTVAMTRTFDAEHTLQQIERERVTVLAVVPAILQRLLASPTFDATDLSSLRIVASSGSALPVPIVEEWLERAGPNLYNLYGSTEVGQATLAEPEDLLAHPDTAGRAMPGSIVAILNDDGTPLPTGETGRIFVGNGAQFEQYTGGGGKEIVGGLMSSGDVGYLDHDGLLFVTGRADDMIVSGGENVFPQEVENLLLSHPEIADAAVVGVDDADFGQRLVAHVVRIDGSDLTEADVKKSVSANLARHKTPRDVRFVDELPRTATGKIRRNQLS
jgi:fatty-acyl-CoA synthase